MLRNWWITVDHENKYWYSWFKSRKCMIKLILNTNSIKCLKTCENNYSKLQKR